MSEDITKLLLIGLNKVTENNKEIYQDETPTFFELNGIYANSKEGRKRKKLHLTKIKEETLTVEMKYLGKDIERMTEEEELKKIILDLNDVNIADPGSVRRYGERCAIAGEMCWERKWLKRELERLKGKEL